jgi:hypothetical protein
VARFRPYSGAGSGFAGNDIASHLDAETRVAVPDASAAQTLVDEF